MIKCPITNSENIQLVEKIASVKIETFYDQLGVETRNVFKNIDHILKYHSTDSGYSFYYPFSIQGTASLYEALEKFEWYYQEQKWEHLTTLNLIAQGNKLLEIGCGQGSFLMAAKKKNGGNPVGLELNQHAVDKAVSLGLNVYNRDLTSFSVENQNCFDIVCLFQVLEHIAQPVLFLQQALRTLKEGGKLIVCVPNNDALVNRDKENPLNLPPHHMGLWNRQSLNFLINVLPVKVELIEDEPLQPYHLDWYVRTLLKKIFGVRLYYWIISKTIIPRLVKTIIVDRASKIQGHSILAVYKK